MVGIRFEKHLFDWWVKIDLETGEESAPTRDELGRWFERQMAQWSAKWTRLLALAEHEVERAENNSLSRGLTNWKAVRDWVKEFRTALKNAKDHTSLTLCFAFGPFGSYNTNFTKDIAEEIVKILKKDTDGAVLSEVFDVMWSRLSTLKDIGKAIEKLSKEGVKTTVISLGIDPAGTIVDVEKVGTNARAGSTTLNKVTETPGSGGIDSTNGTEKQHRARFDVAAVVTEIKKAIAAQSITLSTKDTDYCGRYICNAFAYEIYGWANKNTISGGIFVHLTPDIETNQKAQGAIASGLAKAARKGLLKNVP